MALIPSKQIQGGGGGVSWQTVYSIDYTAQPTQDLTTGGDGAKTIPASGGKSHNVKNTGNATTLGITNGTGLQLGPNTTNSSYYWASDTAPIVRAKISDLWASYNPLNHPLRLWAYFTHNADANYEDATIGFDNRLDASPKELYASMVRQYNGANRWVMRFGDNEPTDYEIDTGTTGHDVSVIELSPQGLVTFFTGAWSSGWPADSTLLHRGEPRLLNNRFGPDLGIVLAATPGNVNGNLLVTVKNLKLEALA